MLLNVHASESFQSACKDTPLWVSPWPLSGANEVLVRKSYSPAGAGNSTTAPLTKSVWINGAVGSPKVNAVFWRV